MARYDRHTGFDRQLLGCDFVPHRGNGGRRRSDENQSGRLHGAREVGVFGKKPIAGMHGPALGGHGRGDDLFCIKIGVASLRAADGHRLVGHLAKEAPAVGLGIDGHRPDTQTFTGAYDAHGDFASIGDQNLIEHDKPHSGMFPCLRSGLLASFPSSTCSVRIRRWRVSRGKITSSI
jgi:hypothetical protein